MLKRVIALIAAGALLLCSASGLALTAQDAAQLNPEETDEDLLSRYRSAWKDVPATDYTLVLVASDASAMAPGMEDFLPQGESIMSPAERANGDHPNSSDDEEAWERDVMTAFFHEMGHVADTDAGGRILKNINPLQIEQTVLQQDDEAINIFFVDSIDFLYNELLTYTDAQTAWKIAINTVRDVQAEGVEEGALSEEEQQIRDKALASIQKDGIENYDEMYTSLDAIRGAIEDAELRDSIAPRYRAEYYNAKIANASGSAKGVAELWAHYFSARMRGDTAEIAAMRKIFPGTIDYFETQVWIRVVNENY